MKLGKSASCWCKSGLKYKYCHAPVDDMAEGYRAKGHIVPARHLLKTKPQVDRMRESGRINMKVLDFIGNFIMEGISTAEIDRLVFQKTKELGGDPATLYYKGYPKSVCVSINEQVCHGIPSEKTVLKQGDIVNIDVSTRYNGYFSDSSRMFCIGKVPEDKEKLVKVAKECMELGIKQVRPWGFLGDIGQAVSGHAKKHGYAVVQEIGGHGIGLSFHEEPWVGYAAKAGTGMLLVPGLCFTVEPMINMGTERIMTDREDGWTVYTADGKPSAQWESMVLVTNEGYEILAS